MMSPHDRFELRIFSRTNPIRTWDGTRRLLEGLLGEAHSFVPTTFHERHDHTEPFSFAAVERRFTAGKPPDRLWFGNDLDLDLEILGYDTDRDPGGRILLRVPFAQIAGRGQRLVAVASGISQIVSPLYGWGHSKEDLSRVRDPNVSNAWARKQVYQAYWLTVLGAPMVKQLGKDHIAATPAHLVQFLGDGAALIVTSPDPGDVLSAAAREAQARALVHLRPDLEVERVLHALLQRTARPLDVAPPPPEVRQWRSAAEAWPADIDQAAAIRGYHLEAENYISGFHDQIEGLIAAKPDILPRIDQHFLSFDYWRKHEVATLERMFVPTLGALLARMMVTELGGRWQPRRNLEQTQVILGDRAWLPFLRVNHFVQSRSSAIENALTPFFSAAQRGT